MGIISDYMKYEVEQTKYSLWNIIRYPLWSLLNVFAFFLFIVPWQLYRYDILTTFEAIGINLLIPISLSAFVFFWPDKSPY
tara:strand:- start:1223 stop:1465 length:243 start_codon:yes stop_codon:yes gene_type:complete